MQFTTRKKVIVVVIISLLSLSYCYGGMVMPIDDIEITSVKIDQLNSLAVDLNVAGQTIYIDLHYPENSILLVDEGGDWKNGVPYELCYNPGSFFTSSSFRNRSWHEKSDYPLNPVSNMGLGGKGDREIRYGRRGDVVYRVDGPLGGKPLMEMAVRALFAAPDTLATCYMPRVQVEQWMQEDWMKLQQYNCAAFMFKMAPENPRKLRFKFAAMRVVFLRERVLIRTGNSTELNKVEFVLQRPTTGYWPHSRGYDELFFSFEKDTINASEYFEASIPVERNFNVSFDARVIEEGELHPKLLHMDLLMPDFRKAFSTSENIISTWELMPSPADEKSLRSTNQKYPDGFVVPRWAAEKMFLLPKDYWMANAPNDSIYFQELKEISDAYVKRREEERAKKKRDPHHQRN